jgi:hypothetical protein
VILDGEEDEALRVLLEQRLIGLLRVDRHSLGLRLLVHGCLLLVLGVNLCLERGEVGVERCVLLVGRGEVELLDWRFHLKGVNCGSSLHVGAYVSFGDTS